MDKEADKINSIIEECLVHYNEQHHSLEQVLKHAISEAKILYSASGVKKAEDKFEWLSEKTKTAVKVLWSTPNENHNNPRVMAIQMIKEEAKEHGYEINILKAMEIVNKHCLTYDKE